MGSRFCASQPGWGSPGDVTNVGLHNEHPRESKREYPTRAPVEGGMRKLLLALTLATGCAPVLVPPPPRVRIYGPRVYVPRPPVPVVVVPAPRVRVWW